MERSEIVDKLLEIITPYVPDKEVLGSLSEETNLVTELAINSANLVDVIIDVELAFDIEIEDDVVERMVVVGDAVSIIQERAQAAADTD